MDSAARAAFVLLGVVGIIGSPDGLTAQTRADSTRHQRADSLARRLKSFSIEADRRAGAITAAPRIVGGVVTTGAKSEVVDVASQSSNLAEKSGRQIFAEVPGVFVYDMDGSGNQINISTRGLDAHRSWEFNVRQNGVLTTSDQYAYPASHYSAPMEAIERVEIVRGTAALQYGSQFGGLINYVVKGADSTRRARAESYSTAGTQGLVSSWNAVGGRVGRVSYYSYLSIRRSDGYRANGESNADAEHLSLSAPVTKSLSLRAELSRSRYRYRQPGPLNDAMFAANSQTSTRSRNWYSPDIIVPALTLAWNPRPSTSATLVASGLLGTRSSVAVGGFATQRDTASTSGLWSARQVDIDRYNSRLLEVRVRHEASISTHPVAFAGGVSLTQNDTRRRQRGVGSRSSDYTLSLQPGTDFQRDLHYRTANAAAYIESEIGVTTRWTIVPGVRVENGTTHMTGRLAYYDPADTPRDISHHFPLFGARSAVKLGDATEWYGGWSQAYRPMILKDVLPETSTERTDSSLKDAKGWTIESGVRGATMRGVTYDVGVFSMRYANRFGMLTLTDARGAALTYKTNVGTTQTDGVEGRVSVPLGAAYGVTWRAYNATSFMHARYAKGSAIQAGRNVDIAGHEVESAPKWITRAGVAARGSRGTVTFQVSHVSRTFADAVNTVQPSANGAVGVVPAYTLADLNGTLVLSSRISVLAGVSNLFDRQYFTKRPQFYPGPGVWPSDGRSLQLSLHAVP